MNLTYFDTALFTPIKHSCVAFRSPEENKSTLLLLVSES